MIKRKVFQENFKLLEKIFMFEKFHKKSKKIF